MLCIPWVMQKSWTMGTMVMWTKFVKEQQSCSQDDHFALMIAIKIIVSRRFPHTISDQCSEKCWLLSQGQLSSSIFPVPSCCSNFYNLINLVVNWIENSLLCKSWRPISKIGHVFLSLHSLSVSKCLIILLLCQAGAFLSEMAFCFLRSTNQALSEANIFF